MRGDEVNPGRQGTDGAICRPVHCLHKVKELFFFFFNYALSAPAFQSKAGTENRGKRTKAAD